MVWRVYTKNHETRITLLANGIVIRDQRVGVFSNNPVKAKLAPGETDDNVMKVTIKDLPISKGNKGVEKYLMTQGIKIRSPVEYAKARNEQNELTEWLNGDRVVFVDTFNDPLPRVTWIGDSKIRLFHRGQPKPVIKCNRCFQEGHFRSQCSNEQVCLVCKMDGHKPGDPKCSGTAKQPHKTVTVFSGKENPLSNFFPCEVRVFGTMHKSAEHAYQYAKAQQAGKNKVAERIMQANSALQAKIEAKALSYNPNWILKKEGVMSEILSEKIKSCKDFADKLMSADKVIAEGVPGELYWSTGLTQEQSLMVKKSSWPGKNIMGKLLSELRESQKKKMKQNIHRNCINSQVMKVTQNKEHSYCCSVVSYKLPLELNFMCIMSIVNSAKLCNLINLCKYGNG